MFELRIFNAWRLLNHTGYSDLAVSNCIGLNGIMQVDQDHYFIGMGEHFKRTVLGYSFIFVLRNESLLKLINYVTVIMT